MHLKEFDELVNIMKRLRKECPWDREQTPQSLRQYILEEAYETIESIDKENWEELKKELGDLLLQVVFQAEIAEEKQRFSLADVIRQINNKLIERHPHVFGDVEVKDAGEVKDNWEQIKVKTENRKSILEGVPKHLSALLRAQRIQDKAAHAGFDWENTRDVIKKIQEEITELEQSDSLEGVEEEIGDLLFSLVNLCRFYNLSAEDALRKTTAKFISRFQFIEQKLAEKNESVKEASLEEMDQLWDTAKQIDNESLDDIIEQFSTEVAKFIDLGQLWQFLIGFCKDVFDVSGVAIISLQYDVTPYQIESVTGFSKKNIQSLLTEEDSPFLEQIETKLSILNRIDLPDESPGAKIMDQYVIHVAIPLNMQDELLGILFLGESRQFKMLPRRRLHLLKLMSSQTAIAIKNIRTIEKMVQSQKMAGLGMLASQLAHDFRSYIALTKNRNNGDKRLAKHAAYMEKMVNDLLNYARPQELRFSTVNINELIDMSLDLVQIPEEIAIEKNYSSNLPQINLDIHQMRRVFINLIENSIRAMRISDSGRIKITTKTLRSPLKFRRNPWIYVEILDEGIGIPEEYVGRLFEPFFTTYKNEGGNGLGLAMVKQIITRHSGFIDVTSKPGKGTIFNIRLPLRDE